MIFRRNILVLIIACCFSCTQESTVPCTNETKLIPNQVEILAMEIANDSIYMSSTIGYAGSEPEIWRIFQKLKQTATEEELVLLCEHESPVVRCYAFQALVENGYKDCYQMVDTHLNDSTKLRTMMGCIRWEMNVSDFYLRVVTPSQITVQGSKLNASELEELHLKKEAYNKK